jgi:putative DNA methylase
VTLFNLEAMTGPATDTLSLNHIPERTALEGDFPAVPLSRIAQHESWRKEIHRPATSTHKWWAKRLGSVFRGILTAAVTEDGDQAIHAYSSATRLDGLVVFDPFAGSGTTAVEAAKLGARAVVWDINPVATLVQRQALQKWDHTELDRAYKLVEENCRAEIDRVHRTENDETVLYYFWVVIAACPVCSADTPLFSSHVFSQNAYPRRVPRAQIVCPTCLDVLPGRYDFEEVECGNGHRVTRRGAVERSLMTCVNGHVSKVLESIGDSLPRYRMFAKLVLDRRGKKRYETITSFDHSLYKECGELIRERSDDLVFPDGRLDDGYNTRQARRWGFHSWHQFFNDRQLYSLGLLAAAIRDVDAGEAEREALAALFSGSLEFNNMFCSFKGEGTGAVRHMFSHHILKPERTPLEAHPWGTPASSGAFSTLFQSRIARAHAYKAQPSDQVVALDGDIERVSGLSLPLDVILAETWQAAGGSTSADHLVRTGDSANTGLPDACVDLVVTDPPYMDNVHYSELADFFHVWLRRIKPFAHYPAHLVSTRHASEVQSGSPEQFRDAISRVWQECARVMKPSALLAFTFHQARLSGWVAVVEALAEAGFVITAVQPVKGEMSTSITKVGVEPSNLDAVVVCRKRMPNERQPPADPREAAAAATRKLALLRQAGVEVGPGDVRSVVRGHVLATYTVSSPGGMPIHVIASLADELASSCVERHLEW